MPLAFISVSRLWSLRIWRPTVHRKLDSKNTKTKTLKSTPSVTLSHPDLASLLVDLAVLAAGSGQMHDPAILAPTKIDLQHLRKVNSAASTFVRTRSVNFRKKGLELLARCQ